MYTYISMVSILENKNLIYFFFLAICFQIVIEQFSKFIVIMFNFYFKCSIILSVYIICNIYIYIIYIHLQLFKIDVVFCNCDTLLYKVTYLKHFTLYMYITCVHF